MNLFLFHSHPFILILLRCLCSVSWASPHVVNSEPRSRENWSQVHVSFATPFLDIYITEEFLEDIFASFGPVADVTVKRHNRSTSNPPSHSGYAFVYFYELAPAARAVQRFSELTDVNNVRIVCNLPHVIRDKHEKPFYIRNESRGVPQPPMMMPHGTPRSVGYPSKTSIPPSYGLVPSNVEALPDSYFSTVSSSGPMNGYSAGLERPSYVYEMTPGGIPPRNLQQSPRHHPDLDMGNYSSRSLPGSATVSGYSEYAREYELERESRREPQYPFNQNWSARDLPLETGYLQTSNVSGIEKANLSWSTGTQYPTGVLVSDALARPIVSKGRQGTDNPSVGLQRKSFTPSSVDNVSKSFLFGAASANVSNTHTLLEEENLHFGGIMEPSYGLPLGSLSGLNK